MKDVELDVVSHMRNKIFSDSVVNLEAHTTRALEQYNALLLTYQGVT